MRKVRIFTLTGEGDKANRHYAAQMAKSIEEGYKIINSMAIQNGVIYIIQKESPKKSKKK